MSETLELKERLARAKIKAKAIETENRILAYRPCCRVHHPGPCPGDCLSSKHRLFHASTARNRFVFGGNSGGKSILGIAESIIHGTFNVHPFSKIALPHPANHRVTFESFRMLESYYLPLFKEWMPRSMLVGDSWSDAYNVKFSILRLKNGDMYDFMSYDIETDKFETSTLHSCWADEKIPEDKYDAILARLLRTNGYFWNTVTPINGMPWILRRVWGKNTPDMQTWSIDMDENPYLNEDAKTRIMAEWSEEEREARKTGRPMQFQGLVYKNLEESIHITDEKPDTHWPIYFALDAHPRKPAQMCWIAVGPGDQLLVVDELEMKGNPKELADAIFRKEYEIRKWIGGPSRVYKGVQRRLIDLSAITLDSDIQDNYDLLSEFRKVGLPFTQANRSGIGYTAVSTHLHYEKSQPVGPFNQPMLKFCRGRVPNTWFSMTHLIYDDYRQRGSRDVKEKVKDWGKDPADCVRYIVVDKPRHQMNMAPVAYGDQGVVSCYAR